jgi:hypothetical protein
MPEDFQNRNGSLPEDERLCRQDCRDNILLERRSGVMNSVVIAVLTGSGQTSLTKTAHGRSGRRGDERPTECGVIGRLPGCLDTHGSRGRFGVAASPRLRSSRGERGFLEGAQMRSGSGRERSRTGVVFEQADAPVLSGEGSPFTSLCSTRLEIQG